MSDKKASDLDVFDELVKKKARESVPDDSGVQPSRPKAPTPPALVSRPKPTSTPPPPPSRGAAVPPAPPSASLRSTLSGPRAPASPPSAPASAPLSSSRAPAPPPRPASSGPVSHPPLPPPPAMRSEDAALQAYSGGSSEDQTPTQLFQPGKSDRLETRSNPYASQPSVEVAPPNSLRQSRPSIVPAAYAHYPQIQSAPPPPAAPKSRIPLIAAAVVMLLVGAFFVMRSNAGSLVVTVSGPGGRMVDGVEVFVDGEKKCGSSPCKIEGIGAGAHFIRAGAVGYQPTADQAVSVTSGEHSTHNLSLVKASATGFKVSASGSGLMLYVDGREIGPLPQTLTELTPGDHTIRIGGNPRYKELEQKVTVEPDTVQQIGPLQLEVLKGLATFKAGPGAEGAKVLVDGRLVPTLPTTVEVPAGKTPQLVAKKPGYVDYRRTISFEDGVAEKTFEITMVEGSSGDSASSRPVSFGRNTSPAPRQNKPSAPASSSGKATLNMNSIPVSNVILNGRPLGQTPKIGVQVPAGPVTVVFVHPEMGRKVQSGTVTAGATRTFSARFP